MKPETDTPVEVTTPPEQPAPQPNAQAVPFLRFDAPLDTEYAEAESKALGKDYWRVLKPFKFYLNPKESDVWVYVPAGYLTDGATVPRVFWWLIPPWGDYGQAAVVHDILCEYLTVYRHGVAEPITRVKTDNVFKDAMIAAGVNYTIRNIMYIAVKVFTKLKHRTLPTTQPGKRAYEDSWRAQNHVSEA